MGDQSQVKPMIISDDQLRDGIRDVMLEPGHGDAWKATDDQGKPLPRLDLANPPASTDNALLAVGYSVLPNLPDGWETVVLSVTAAAEDVRTSMTVRVRTEGPPKFLLRLALPGVATACLKLRASTVGGDGRGAWYNALFRLERSGQIAPRYDFDQPPYGYWGSREVDLLRRDHDLYPRSSEHLPDWHPVRVV